MTTQKRSMTVRLPADLYDSSAEVAKRREMSLNALVQEGLTMVLKKEQYARLYEAFGQLGEDAEESNVEFASHAQWEVIRRREGQS
jgi:hypothetical protein